MRLRFLLQQQGCLRLLRLFIAFLGASVGGLSMGYLSELEIRLAR
jgi:hypothetical protein